MAGSNPRSLKTRSVCLLLPAAAALYGQSWQPQASGTTVSLRGISAVNTNVAYASGAEGTILKTTDGGMSWRKISPPGVADLDFRDIQAIDETTVFAMSAGDGPQSRLYKSIDGGERWALLRVNGELGFWDAIAFWDADHGILLGDPVEGRFTILTTDDGGIHWVAREGPKADKGEAAFAASGTALFTRGTREAWFGSGGAKDARVFYTEDGGKTWSDKKTPVRAKSEGAGVFSLAFSNRLGVAVGGDYTKPDQVEANWAISEDGGESWTQGTGAGPRGYRSAVAYDAAVGMWITTGTSGTEWSMDGRTWQPVMSEQGGGYNALSFAADGSGWGVGADGSIARFVFVSP